MRNGSTMIWKPGVGAQVDRSHPAARGLQACWLFNEGGGGAAYDLAGSYHYALNSGVSNSSGPFGTALKFNGTSGQGVAPGHPLAGATSWSVAMHIRQTDAISNPYGPYLGSDQSYTTGMYLGQDSSGTALCYVGSHAETMAITNGVWCHIGWTYNGATLLGYLNGVQTVSVSVAVGAVPAYANCYIGKGSSAAGSYLTDSYVGDMKVWNRALSAAEVAADYEWPYAVLTPPNARRFYSVPGSLVLRSGQAGLAIGAGSMSISI